MPSFQADVTTAFNEMTSLESPNDFFIAGFAPGTEQLELRAKGKGGLPEVRKLLLENFENDVAVTMFRITAVDDRGKVKSFRTKLIHCVYIGPKTPVMKRAKIGPWNAALKQPFTMNLSIQTDDVDNDLSEAALERSLRASGGAHQPTYFDFSNSEGSAGNLESSSMSLPSPKASPPDSPSNAPRSPSGTRSYTVAFNEHNKAFHARDIESIGRQYSEEYCKLIYTDASTGSVIVSERIDAVVGTLSQIFDQYRDEYEIVKVEKTQPDADHTSEGIVFCYWTSEQGSVSGFDTLCIVGGKIVVHTLVISRRVDIHEDAQDATSQATAEFEDTEASNRADPGDVPSQEATSEPPEVVSQAPSEDDFVEVDQPPISVGESTEEEPHNDEPEADEPFQGNEATKVESYDNEHASADDYVAQEFADSEEVEISEETADNDAPEAEKSEEQ